MGLVARHLVWLLDGLDAMRYGVMLSLVFVSWDGVLLVGFPLFFYRFYGSGWLRSGIHKALVL